MMLPSLSARRGLAVLRTVGTSFLALGVLFYSFGGVDLYFGLMTPFAPIHAGASYTGKHLRTVEYMLGGGTDNTTNGSTVTTYGGSSWSTTKATAGTQSIQLQGTGIAVKSAYLDVSYIISTNVNETNAHVVFDVGGSSSGGTDVPVAEELSAGQFLTSGLSGYVRHQYDVTSFFDRQSDALWNAGVPVVAGVQATFSGVANRALTTVKLVVTYEENYSIIAHTETKTVRFPLASSAVSDRGTRGTACAAAATCSFTYTANIPDAVADADILDVYVEMHGEVNSGTASTFQMGIRGGNASSSAFAWLETSTDDTVVSATWSPSAGSPNFQRNTAQTVDVKMGTVAMNALGGELVVTYNYSTGATAQTETVKYFMDQQTGAPGITRDNFATTTMTISNGGLSMKNVWFKVHAAPVAANTFTVFGKVGTSTEASRAITIAATNPRSGDDHTIIFDLSDRAGNFFTSSADITGATQFSAGGAPPGVEVYFTFTWSGSAGGPQTQTVLFSGAQQGANSAAAQWNNRAVSIDLPETVTKTYRSAYLETKYVHSQATSINVGTVTIGVNSSTTVITESADATSESYTSTYFANIAPSTFSNGSTIAWTKRVLEINETRDQANRASFSNVVVVTYDVDFSQTQEAPVLKHLRTVEYMLGGGTDNSTNGTGVMTYGGATWNANKATAGTQSIQLQGTGISIKNAYLDVSYIIATNVNETNAHVVFDVGGSSSGGTDVPVAEELSAGQFVSSGLSGYVRHQYDVTSFFDRQSDASWNAGLPVEVGVQSIFAAAANRALTTVKLVVTYEENYSLVPHTETKTVRFPLASTAVSDRGTRGTACAAAATCSFTYTANIPDAVADADILDVYVEMHGEVSTNGASTFQMGIRGGNASSSAFAWLESSNDDTVVSSIWSPTAGSPNFQRNTLQTIDVLMGTVAMNALGGELVVTYNYSTGATAQTETVRYFLDQRAAAPGATRNNFSTTTMTISNGGLSMKNVWFKVHTAPVAGNNFTIFGKVGTSTEASRAITILASNPRAGDDQTLIFDLSDRAGNFFTASTDIAGGTQFSAGGAPPGVEVYFTFVWKGDLGGTQTQTVSFGGSPQGANSVATQWYNRPMYIDLPETVTKTYRSAYLETKYIHSNPTTITTGTVTIGVNGSTTVVTESADATSESYTSTYFANIASSTFSNGSTIAWTERVLEINETRDQANRASFSNVVVVTYDAAQELKVPKLSQNYFRFYVDNNALKPTDPWPLGAVDLGENTEITAGDEPPISGDKVRLRMSFSVATTTLLSTTTTFRLQYAPRVSSCSAVSSWSDVGASGSAAMWRGFNGTPVAGTALSGNPPTVGDLLLSVSDRAGTYEEGSPSAINPFSVFVGEDVEYDWLLQQNSAATNTPYCFRMAYSDGSSFDSYAFYPVIRTGGYYPQTRNWRWYSDIANETPTVSLAAENTAPTNIDTGYNLKLRITVGEKNAIPGVDQKFKLQYSTYSDFSQGVTDVAATSSCTTGWCYADGVDQDGAPISSLLLTDSVNKGTHNEAGTSSSTYDPAASTNTEFEFTIKDLSASPASTYFFRLWDVTNNHAVPLVSGHTYPSLTTGNSTLGVTVSGLATSTVTEGITTTIATAANAIAFGAVIFGTSSYGAQRFTVTTNATQGYQILAREDQDMIAANGATILGVAASNTSPAAWSTGCPVTSSSCWGYHAGDDVLSGGSSRFSANDTWAALETTGREVVYSSGPVTNESTDIVYRLYVRPTQLTGNYQQRLIYIVTPTF